MLLHSPSPLHSTSLTVKMKNSVSMCTIRKPMPGVLDKRKQSMGDGSFLFHPFKNLVKKLPCQGNSDRCSWYVCLKFTVQHGKIRKSNVYTLALGKPNHLSLYWAKTHADYILSLATLPVLRWSSFCLQDCLKWLLALQ